MEKFIIGLFSEQLETYIEGFHKEKVNANLLNGKGEISDVRVKVKPINDILKSYTSLVELSSVYISKLSFNVTSFRNIKKAPIEIYIDEVHVVLVEPLEYDLMSEAAWPELAKQIVEKAKKKGSYGLTERIQDNITLDINRVYVTFQPMGNLKTRKIGPWTPPAISVVFNNLRYVSVDEYGEEGSPDEIWRHNTHAGKQDASFKQKAGNNGNNGNNDRGFRHRTVMIYKKVTMEVSGAVGYRSEGMGAKESFMSSKVLFADLPLQAPICLHRRIRNNVILAVQVDASLMTLEIELDMDVLPMLIHAMTGIQACFKGRAYKDPFANQNEVTGGGTMQSSVQNADVLYGTESDVKAVKDTNILDNSYASDESMSGEEEDNGANSSMSIEGKESWPVLILPAGLIILEKIALSFSVHHIGLRISYPSDVDGYLQLTIKGWVLELISPKINSTSLGGYIQTSLCNINVQETHLRTTRQIMHGGHRYDSGFEVKKQTTADEMFPIFEQAYVRSDPDDLRSSFPVQAFGLKISIDVLGKEQILESTSKLSISNELGINDFDVTIIPQAVLRLKASFDRAIDNVDQRWFTGEWCSETGINESEIDNYVYSPQLSGGSMSTLDPQNINLTSRICGCKIILPPCEASNIKSGTLTVSVTDMILNVSTSLPRMFLSEEIPSLAGTDSAFPNDREDFKYESMTGLDQVSRGQFTLIGLAAIFQPSLPFYNAPEATRIFGASKLTVLGSYDTSKLDIRGSRKHLFLSSIFEGLDINVDFDVISSMLTALGTFKDYVPLNMASTDDINLLDLISAFNITNRFSLDQVSFSLWKQQVQYREWGNDDTAAIKIPQLHLLLRLKVEQIEFGMQLFPCEIESPERFFSAKGKLGNTCLTTSKSEILNTIQGVQDSSYDDVVIVLFGSKGTDQSTSVAFRLEKGHIQGALSAVVMISGGEINVTEEVDKAIINIVDSLFHQGWQVHPSSHFTKEKITDDNIDWRLQILSFLLCTDPDKVSFVNIAIQMKTITLRIPFYGQEAKAIDLVCDDFRFYTGYLRNNSTVPAQYEKDWKSFYRDGTQGFHHLLSSRQKCIVYDGSEPLKEVLSSFSTDAYLHPSNLRWSVDECALSVEELCIIHDLKETMSVLQNRIMGLHREANILLAQPQPNPNPHNLGDMSSDSMVGSDDSPMRQSCAVTSREISRMRSVLVEAKDYVLSEGIETSQTTKDSDDEILHLRKQLFRAEIERLAALSLVSHQMSGFIRMSATAISGQRFSSATTFWSFYAILRDSHLVIFKDSSQTKPFALITLTTASVKSVTGSGAKRIFTRAFAIVENTGKETVFIAESFAEFEKWIPALKRSCGEGVSSVKTATASLLDIIEPTRFLDTSPEVDVNTISSDIIDSSSVNISFDDDADLEALNRNEFGEQLSITDSFVGIDAASTVSEDGIEDFHSYASKSDDIEGITSKRGAKFRDRMAKIKSSVKNNVKNINENVNVKIMKMEKHVMKPAFARSNIQHSGSRQLSINAPLKLKQVKVAIEEPQAKEQIKLDPEQKLHTVPGEWICSVSITSNRDRLSQLDHPSEQETQVERLFFSIHMSRESIATNIASVDSSVVKSLSDILKLYTTISEVLVAIQNDPLAAGLGRDEIYSYQNLFSQVLSSGRVLSGLLNLLQKGDMPNFDYIGIALATFFECIFATVVPTMVLKTVLQFLNLQDVVTDDPSLIWDTEMQNCDDETKVGINDIKDQPSEKLYSLLHSCELAIARTERQMTRLQMFASLPQHQLNLPSREKGSGHRFTIYSANKIMMDALTSVMSERDGAHSALVSSTVLHTHEIEMRRKRIEMLESKLKSIREWSDRNSAPAAAFFLGQLSIPDINSLTTIEKKMIQNVEVELFELCKQLSISISTRLAAELEIVRIKELNRIEKEVHIAERERLEKELAAMRLKAEEELLKREASELDARKWKESFEALLNSD